MKKTMKCMIALAFAMTMLCSLVANAAMPESEIMPLYNFIDGTEASLKPSLEGRGTASAVDECAR